MLAEQSRSQLKNLLAYSKTPIALAFDCSLSALFHQQTDLRVTASSHRTLIDVCRPTNCSLVIDDYEFGVKVDDLGARCARDNSMSAQSEELDIASRIHT